MINCNPETVSTDYDTSDRLYFEPLTLEDVLAVCEIEHPAGVIVQFGGQTPLKLAAGLNAAGVPILGTSVDAIDLAEDRWRFGALLDELGYKAPPYATARSPRDALEEARERRLPAARAPELRARRPRDGDRLQRRRLADVPGPRRCPSRARTIYLDRFLEDSIEVDVDALCDGDRCLDRRDHAARRGGRDPLGRLGLRAARRTRSARRCSGRSAIRPRAIARALGVVGLLNVQFAIRERHAVRDRGQPARVAHGAVRLEGDRAARGEARVPGACSASASPISTCPPDTEPTATCASRRSCCRSTGSRGADSLLGPEMRSTGEVMGIARDFPTAFAKAQAAAGAQLPDAWHRRSSRSPTATSRRPRVSRRSCTTSTSRSSPPAGTAQAIRKMGIPAETINKIGEGSPHVVDWIERGEVDLVINTPVGTGARADGWEIRSAAIARGIPCVTTMTGGMAAARAIAAARRGEPEVLSLQEIHHRRASEVK